MRFFRARPMKSWNVRPRLGRLKSRMGQATVEYMLTTMLLVTIFSAMYGFLHKQVTVLFKAAGIKILMSYY